MGGLVPPGNWNGGEFFVFTIAFRIGVGIAIGYCVGSSEIGV